MLLSNIFLQTSSQVNLNSWAIGGIYVFLVFITLYITNSLEKAKKLFSKNPLNNYITTEAKLKSIDLNINGIINCDENGMILTWNKGACKIFGWEEYQVVGKCISLILPESVKEEYKKALFQFRDTGFSEIFGKPLKVMGITKLKKEVPIEINLSQWRNDDHVFFTAIVIDTTEQKKLERELEKIMNLYRHAESIENYGAWKWDLITDEVFFTQGFKDIYEMTAGSKESYQEAIGRIHYEDRAYVEEKIRNGIKNKVDYSMDYRIIAKNGRIKNIRNKARIWIGESGVEKIYGIIQEIKE